MTALRFRCRRRRFRITSESHVGVEMWVMEEEGAYSKGSGLHTNRHCWAAVRTPAGLTSLIVAATTPW